MSACGPRSADDTYKVTQKEAKKIAQLALEKDGRRLFRMWQREGVCMGDRTRSTISLNHEAWARLHYDFVVLTWDEAADSFWKQRGRDAPNCLCNCLPFALWAACEHESCLRDLKPGDFSLATCGQKTSSPKASKHVRLRGLSARARAFVKKAASKAKRGAQAGAKQTASKLKRPQRMQSRRAGAVSDSVAWVTGMDKLGLKSDAAAAPAARKKDLQPRVRQNDPLQVLLRRADAAQWYGPLLKIGCSASALTTGVISARDLCTLTEPAMPLEKAAFIVKAASDPDFLAPGAAAANTKGSKRSGAAAGARCAHMSLLRCQYVRCF